MKQYTTPEQTAKLIELGFTQPKTKLPFEVANDELGYTYSIGELIGILPPIYSDKWKGDCYINIRHDSVFWFVGYIVSGARKPHIRLSNIELVDTLYDMILKLKEEEII